MSSQEGTSIPDMNDADNSSLKKTLGLFDETEKPSSLEETGIALTR